MTHSEFATKILATLQKPAAALAPLAIEETRRNNAARWMTHIISNRLAADGQAPRRIKYTTFEWQGGWIALRNARITDHHWSTLQLSVAQQLHREAEQRPVAYLLTYWAIDEGILHLWAVPEDVADQAFAEIPPNRNGTSKTVEVFPQDHSLKNAPNAPSFLPSYLQLPLSGDERTKLIEAVKVDHIAKRAHHDSTLTDRSEDDSDDEQHPFFTTATVDFLKELPAHVEDPNWHKQNKRRYERLLRDPCRSLVDALRQRYIERLSPEVAGGKRHLSILKKNDYGKDGYHDYYWFAFYDPAAGSKTKSVQLFMHLRGSDQVWGYGFGMGSYCEKYVERLRAAIWSNARSVASYLRQAPTNSIVRLKVKDDDRQMSPSEFASIIESSTDDSLGMDGALTEIGILRRYPLAALPDHDEELVDEIGDYFTWAWPFFEASRTGEWPLSPPVGRQTAQETDSEEDVDEDAPETLAELRELTSLPLSLLDKLEQSLLAKQQTILVGPPGTSKTYIAGQFARYFVRQRKGRPQGCSDTLYMHANWTYEDFFEGIKPTTSEEGSLAFKPQKGFFLEWVEQLKTYDTSARHVLVLDEINRCDTAAVLGELLQLLEYRGTTVRLLSGRRFVLPRNLFVIGTMNSADRSIGRMDLALRRRFFWLDLYPCPETLQRWLGQAGNNPVGFEATALIACNDILADHGIPKVQHVGHALFMAQELDDDTATGQDTPLTDKNLRRIVEFSVLPYVRELFIRQFGQADEEVIRRIRSTLLSCLDAVATGEGQDVGQHEQAT